MSSSSGATGRQPGRIGPWRLIDLAAATMPLRAGMIGGAAVLPEFGPPDAAPVITEPEQELPDSNIALAEQHQAMRREQSRRELARRKA